MEKARFYRMARRSCYETGAALDFLEATGALQPSVCAEAEHQLGRVSAALSAMIRTMEKRAA
jgi:four helix bundle protein